jgi:CDGSH-type Zn-finger protein/uncharacterized Fe-S cluster protein YjdI
MSDERDPGDARVGAASDAPPRGVDRGDRVHEFDGPGIRVTWSKRRCIHVGECVLNLPAVFEPGHRPWIDAGKASPEAIATIVARCPTGALHVERTDGAPAEAVPDANLVYVSRHGPLYLRGDVHVLDEAGALRLTDTRVALCRCGRSANKPFCNGAHLVTGFRDPGVVGEGAVAADAGVAGDAAGPDPTLRVRPEPNGPYQLEGPFTLVSADGGTQVSGRAARLCRCGQSRSKPFCDGSHQRASVPGS